MNGLNLLWTVLALVVIVLLHRVPGERNRVVTPRHPEEVNMTTQPDTTPPVPAPDEEPVPPQDPQPKS
jgi:hypothetical protein